MKKARYQNLQLNQLKKKKACLQDNDFWRCNNKKESQKVQKIRNQKNLRKRMNNPEGFGREERLIKMICKI